MLDLLAQQGQGATRDALYTYAGRRVYYLGHDPIAVGDLLDVRAKLHNRRLARRFDDVGQASLPIRIPMWTSKAQNLRAFAAKGLTLRRPFAKLRAAAASSFGV